MECIKNKKRDRSWEKNNPEKVKESNRKYYQTHKKDCNKRSKEWGKKHPGHSYEACRAWNKRNREKTLQYHKKTYAKYRKKYNAISREYSKTHRKSINSCRVTIQRVLLSNSGPSTLGLFK